MNAGKPLGVTVIGGGVSALEVLLALRDLAGERVDLTFVAPVADFEYRPLAVAEPFSLGRVKSYPLSGVAKDVDAKFVQDRVVEVDPEASSIKLETGDDLSYEALIVAMGAKTEVAFKHGITIGDPKDPALHGLLEDLEQGFVRRVAFVVPPDVTWILPLYEVALMVARELWSQSAAENVELSFITPEDGPLSIFGSQASDAVGNLLSDAGIKFEGSTYAEVEHDAVILMPNSRRVDVDRVVTLPRLAGPRLAGLPVDSDGFIPTDEYGRVRGVSNIFAAGDAVSFPIKQGGLATQQADSVASVIANLVDGETVPQKFQPILRGVLLTGGIDRFLRQHAAGGGGEGEFQMSPLWWPPTKIVGKYITSYLYNRDESEVLASAPAMGSKQILVEKRLDSV